jgi:uncharacterized protein (DUF433 family)
MQKLIKSPYLKDEYMEITTLTAVLISFLPTLLKLGGNAVDKDTESAAGKFGETNFAIAQAIWEELNPQVQVREAAINVANNNREDSQAALRLQLKKLLLQDKGLKKSIEQIFQKDDGVSNNTIVQNVTENRNRLTGQKQLIEIYGGEDPRDVPTYNVSEAARYLRIPVRTLRSWVSGRRYPITQQFFAPLIPLADSSLLSFINLVEIHVLRAIRKHHKIQLDKVRVALNYLESQLQIAHPLAHSDGIDLFIDHYNTSINIPLSEQRILKDLLTTHLERIELDDTGLAIKLYPFTRSQETNSPRSVVLDPRIAFGQLVIVGTGIPTKIVAERYVAGDSLEDLADDYNCARRLIEEAIRCEMPSSAT